MRDAVLAAFVVRPDCSSSALEELVGSITINRNPRRAHDEDSAESDDDGYARGKAGDYTQKDFQKAPGIRCYKFGWATRRSDLPLGKHTSCVFTSLNRARV